MKKKLIGILLTFVLATSSAFARPPHHHCSMHTPDWIGVAFAGAIVAAVIDAVTTPTETVVVQQPVVVSPTPTPVVVQQPVIVQQPTIVTPTPVYVQPTPVIYSPPPPPPPRIHYHPIPPPPPPPSRIHHPRPAPPPPAPRAPRSRRRWR